MSCMSVELSMNRNRYRFLYKEDTPLFVLIGVLKTEWMH